MSQMQKIIILFIVSIGLSISVIGQHEHHQPVKDTATKAKARIIADTSANHKHIKASAKDTVPLKTHDHDDHANHAISGNTMTHAFSRNLPMTRNGSGTAWVPDNSPMYGYMFHTPKWMYMVHGNTFLRYNKQDLFNKGGRGDEKFDIPNMWMFMGQRNVGKRGLFHFSTMISLDPITIGDEGYPLLFQTGETYKGQPLIDRQHPHDLISELSVSYAHALSPRSDIFLYIGYPGEPALGPAAFVHRASGFMNPDAPLTHH